LKYGKARKEHTTCNSSFSTAKRMRKINTLPVVPFTEEVCPTSRRRKTVGHVHVMLQYSQKKVEKNTAWEAAEGFIIK
jgi:hypothetical protein